MINGSVINPSIGAGELVHSIQIQQPQTAAAGSTGMSITPGAWTTVRTTFAAIGTAGGAETSQASQLLSEVSHVVKVRYTPTRITANYRVLFGARVFAIKFVENVGERNRVLALYCLEIDGVST